MKKLFIVLKKYDISLGWFIAHMRFSRSTLDNYKSGKTSPTKETLDRMVEVINIDRANPITISDILDD